MKPCPCLTKVALEVKFEHTLNQVQVAVQQSQDVNKMSTNDEVFDFMNINESDYNRTK